MRKFLFISLAILLVCGVALAAPGDQTSPGHGDKLGQGGLASDAHKIFRLVRYMPNDNNISAITLTADSVVIWDLVSDDGVTITTSTTSGDAAVAGIVVNACLTPETLGNTAFADVGKRNWTWLQTYGLASVAKFNADAVGAAGKAFGCGDQKGLAGLTQGVEGTAQPMSAGFIYDAVTAGATDVDVFLKCD